VVLIGSMLGCKDPVSDVDLSIKFVNRPNFDTLSRASVMTALNRGRHFRSFFDELFWPTREIVLNPHHNELVLTGFASQVFRATSCFAYPSGPQRGMIAQTLGSLPASVMTDPP
jgi:hypothetical protein